jgi:nitroreductase
MLNYYSFLWYNLYRENSLEGWLVIMNEILSNILTRTSIRLFNEKPVEKEKIDLLLKAAMAAPTGKNRRPWEFIIIQNKETLTKLSDAMPYAKMTAKAPLAIVICANTDKLAPDDNEIGWICDCSAATQNLLLAANSLELGATWTAIYAYENRIKPARSILKLPDNIIPLSLIPIGYPAKKFKPMEKFDETKIHYEQW